MAGCRLLVFLFLVLLSGSPGNGQPQGDRLPCGGNLAMSQCTAGIRCGQSTLWKNSDVCMAAINGNTDRTFIDRGNPPTNCMWAAEATPAFWWLDLGQPYTINRITLYTTDEGYLRDVTVTVDGAVITSDLGTTIPSEITSNLPRQGRNITITRGNETSSLELMLCEVQVWGVTGCPVGKYGEQCDNDCSLHCNYNNGETTCDNFTGNCKTGCQDGWWGLPCTTPCPPNCARCSQSNGDCQQCSGHFTLQSDCRGCDAGYYGLTCRSRCSLSCAGTNNPCAQVSGKCMECAAGHYGTTCQSTCSRKCAGTNNPCEQDSGKCTQGCVDGYFGQQCQTPCSRNCGGRTKPCDRTTGECKQGCVDGYNGQKCQCSDNCKGWRHPCDENTGVCTLGCVDGHSGQQCQTPCNSNCGGRNNQCDQTTGACTQGCDAGYYGPTCQSRCSFSCAGISNPCAQESGKCAGCDTGRHGTTCQFACSANCALQGNYRPCAQDSGRCTECVKGHYGGTCDSDCGRGCSGNVCERNGGTCNCTPGWQSPKCTVCDDNHYGNDCANECGHCAHEAACQKETGHCPNGCNPGWIQPYCKEECYDGYYGAGCIQHCGNCADDTPCDKVDGHCATCKPGYRMPLCKTECPPGRYGSNCPNYCGNCQINEVCDPVTGHCTACKPGYSLPFCEAKCNDGFYGDNCSHPCGQCADGQPCDKTRGQCDICAPGYVPNLCQEKCSPGLYGQDCLEECGNCAEGTVCNHVTGHCIGCEGGFDGALCKICKVGLYGLNCSLPCGHCGGNGSCSMETADCHESECDPGWNGTDCRQALFTSSQETAPVAGIVCGVLGAIIAAAVVVVVVIFRRRQHTHKRDSRAENDDSDKQMDELTSEQTGGLHSSETQGRHKSAKSGPAGSKPAVPVKPMIRGVPVSGEQSGAKGHIYGNTDTVEAESAGHLYGNIPAASNAKPTNKNGRPPVAAPRPSAKPSRGNVYENVQLSGGAGQRPQPPPKPAAESRVSRHGMTSSSGVVQKGDEYEEEEDVYNTEDLYACYNTVSTKPQLDALQKYLLEALASGDLSSQFGEFAKGMTLPHKDGMSEVNVRKNRFKAMCAYDFNRVHLHRTKGDPDTDYINASYIKGCRGDKQYIATQGPRDTHVNDLWWMVWQEKATQVVMLTNLIEDGKDKCEEYWPAAGQKQTYGHVTVRGLDVEERADFVIRPFMLKVKGAGERQVTQCHFNTWPDHGVPQASALVDFWRYVKARGNPIVPLIVHCSAGVGRTGTFIALDIASELEAGGREVNVQQIVIQLREQRCIMVQSEAQYKFLHEAILEAHTSRDTRIPADKFEETFPDSISVNHNNRRIDREFKMLEEMGKYRPKRSYRMANMKENLDKNRNQDAVPDDDHIVYLNVHVRGRNQYINAVYMSSLRKRQGLVLTQLPIRNKTLVDFWRMVDGSHVNTIVSIGSKNEAETVKDYCRFWPPSAEESITTGPYLITSVSYSVLSDHLLSHTLRLKHKSENKVREVQLLHYKDWAGELPDDMSGLIQLVDTVKAEDDAGSPIVIQCIDGAAKSGLFCAIYDIINRLTYDDEIDVYMTARYVQSIRPQAVSTEAQYRYLYKVAQEYISHLSVYQNTHVRA